MMKTLAERLRHYMDLANMRQVELCEKTGIDKSSISQYLSGRFEPKQKNIYKISIALGIKPSQLLGADEEDIDESRSISQEEQSLLERYRQAPEAMRAYFNLSGNEYELLQFFRSLNEERQYEILGMARLLAYRQMRANEEEVDNAC